MPTMERTADKAMTEPLVSVDITTSRQYSTSSKSSKGVSELTAATKAMLLALNKSQVAG